MPPTLLILSLALPLLALILASTTLGLSSVILQFFTSGAGWSYYYYLPGDTYDFSPWEFPLLRGVPKNFDLSSFHGVLGAGIVGVVAAVAGIVAVVLGLRRGHQALVPRWVLAIDALALVFSVVVTGWTGMEGMIVPRLSPFETKYLTSGDYKIYTSPQIFNPVTWSCSFSDWVSGWNYLHATRRFDDFCKDSTAAVGLVMGLMVVQVGVLVVHFYAWRQGSKSLALPGTIEKRIDESDDEAE